jgi:DNA processing protein
MEQTKPITNHIAHPISTDELAAWLRLMLTDGVGNTSAQKLLAAFGLPPAIFEQPRSSLLHFVTERQSLALQSIPEALNKQVDLCAKWLAADTANRRIVTLGDALYPKALLTLPDPPLVLWLLGRIDLLEANGWPASISMVGSRNPTNSGEKSAHAFAQSFVNSGFCVVSGMALGIDAAAHFGALSAARPTSQNDAGSRINMGTSISALCTIAIVGTGLDRVYPKQNLELAHRIADFGLMMSEFPLGSAPIAANFPKRNRLIAALGLGTLVVEAALQSGSLITARESLDLGKDVFAIPGSIHSAQSKGCHALIKQGAKLVESADDVLGELQVLPTLFNELKRVQNDVTNKLTGPNSSPRRTTTTQTQIAPADSLSNHPVLKALGFDLASFDALQARLDVDAATLQVQLLELEMDNMIVRLPGGLYQVNT